MADEIKIKIDTTENATETLEKIGSTTVRTERVIVQSMSNAGQSFNTAARSTGNLKNSLDSVADQGGTLADGMDSVGQVTQSVSDIMSYSERKAEALAAAEQDIKQASQDAEQSIRDLEQATRNASQAMIDGEQAGINYEQALLDEKTAQDEYNAAVAANGPNSAEAQQAQIKLKQALLDQKQATEEGKQAQEDLAQANMEAKQATLDHSDAQNKLTASQRELAQQGSTLQQITEWSGMLSGVLGGLVGILGAVTAAQWAWNVATTANPIGLIIVAIAALIAIIILIATKTTWFQDLWNWIWGKIGDPVKAVWAWLKDSAGAAVDFIANKFMLLLGLPDKIRSFFSRVGDFITAPFKAAFNWIAHAWNSTVGNLHFSIPKWVPEFGGNSFGMPKIPMLQKGGRIIREGLIYGHAGETVVPAMTIPLSTGGNSESLELSSNGTQWDDMLLDTIARALRRYGGRPDRIGIKIV